jgi:hypothetical protein
MAGTTENGDGRHGSRWRIAVWSAAALALLLPLVAMQFTDEVVWNLADFAIAAVLLFGAALAYELLAKKADNIAYRAAAGVAVGTALLLVWVNLAVGIIGDEENPANLMYVAVLAVAFLGAIVARFQPNGMARALIATALAQALVAMIAGIAGMGYPASPPPEIFGVNALFAALWLISAWLFRKAAREQAPRSAAS